MYWNLTLRGHSWVAVRSFLTYFGICASLQTNMLFLNLALCQICGNNERSFYLKYETLAMFHSWDIDIKMPSTGLRKHIYELNYVTACRMGREGSTPQRLWLPHSHINDIASLHLNKPDLCTAGCTPLQKNGKTWVQSFNGLKCTLILSCSLAE